MENLKILRIMFSEAFTKEIGSCILHQRVPPVYEYMSSLIQEGCAHGIVISEKKKKPMMSLPEIQLFLPVPHHSDMAV